MWEYPSGQDVLSYPCPCPAWDVGARAVRVLFSGHRIGCSARVYARHGGTTGRGSSWGAARRGDLRTGVSAKIFCAEHGLPFAEGALQRPGRRRIQIGLRLTRGGKKGTLGLCAGGREVPCLSGPSPPPSVDARAGAAASPASASRRTSDHRPHIAIPRVLSRTSARVSLSLPSPLLRAPPCPGWETDC